MPATRTLGLGVVAVTLALAYGIWYAYSVILVALLNEYGWSRSVLAGAAGWHARLLRVRG